MKRPQIGDVFRTEIAGEEILLQLVGNDPIVGEIARVGCLKGPDVCNFETLFSIGFPMAAAVKSGYLSFALQCSIPREHFVVGLKIPLQTAANGDVTKWSVFENGRQTTTSSLSAAQRKYPFAYAVNINKLEELIATRWDGDSPL